MQVQLIGDEKSPIVVIDDFVSENHYGAILQEISMLDQKITLPPENSGSAVDNGKQLKRNTGLWLCDYYNIRKSGEGFKNSPILGAFAGLLTNEEKASSIGKMHPFFSLFPIYCAMNSRNNLRLPINFIGYLLSKYQNGDYYEYHHDGADYTLVYYAYEEKQFEGGNIGFYFGGEHREIESKPNRLVIFPSFYTHKVYEIKYLTPSAKPRYGISCFLRHDNFTN
jgi:hypothetical protein